MLCSTCVADIVVIRQPSGWVYRCLKCNKVISSEIDYYQLEDPIDAIMAELGFCLYGDPDNVVRYIRGQLEQIKQHEQCDLFFLHFAEKMNWIDYDENILNTASLNDKGERMLLKCSNFVVDLTSLEL